MREGGGLMAMRPVTRRALGWVLAGAGLGVLVLVFALESAWAPRERVEAEVKPFHEWFAENFPEWGSAFPPPPFQWVADDQRPAPGDARLYPNISDRSVLGVYGYFWKMLEEAACKKGCGYEFAWALLEDADLAYESEYFDSLERARTEPALARQKGSTPVSHAEPAAEGMEGMKQSRPRNSKLVAACAGLTLAACSAVQVRQVDTEWLEDCPPKARAAIRELGLGTGEPYQVRLLNETGRRNETPFFLKGEGPVVAAWDGGFPGTHPPPEVQQQLKKAKLFGEARILGDRMSVHFDRLLLADGREFPVCAVGYSVWLTEPGVERWGPGSHQGVDVGNDDPRLLAALADLRPGEFPVPGTSIWISFGSLFRPELFSRSAPRR